MLWANIRRRGHTDRRPQKKKKRRKKEEKKEKRKRGGVPLLHIIRKTDTQQETQKMQLSKGVWRDLYVGCYHVTRWGEIGAGYMTHNIRSGLSVTIKILSPKGDLSMRNRILRPHTSIVSNPAHS